MKHLELGLGIKLSFVWGGVESHALMKTARFPTDWDSGFNSDPWVEVCRLRIVCLEKSGGCPTLATFEDLGTSTPRIPLPGWVPRYGAALRLRAHSWGNRSGQNPGKSAH